MITKAGKKVSARVLRHVISSLDWGNSPEAARNICDASEGGGGQAHTRSRSTRVLPAIRHHAGDGLLKVAPASQPTKPRVFRL